MTSRVSLIAKGSKNVFHKNKKRCRDGAMYVSLKNTCACMEKPTDRKAPGTRRGTIPWSPTEVNILRRPGTIKEGYHSMLENPGEYSAAS